MPESPRIAVLGAGNMGGALLAGMLRSGAAHATRVVATTATREHAAAITERHSIRASAGGNLDAASGADIVVLAVKPHILPGVLEEIRWGLREGRILVSVAAAVSIATIERIVNRPLAIFRAMPNTPVLAGEGATCIAANSLARPEQYQTVEHLFRSVGAVCYTTEEQLHAVTALSGAGPAYMYTVIEALTAAGLNVGLPRPVAALLAQQTMLGAAKLARDSGEHPAVLRDQVITPGGVTIAGLHELEKAGIRGAFMDAVQAAWMRSREIGAAFEEVRPAE